MPTPRLALPTRCHPTAHACPGRPTPSPATRCCLSFFFSSRRRHTRSLCDWSSDVCSSDLIDGKLILLVIDNVLLIDGKVVKRQTVSHNLRQHLHRSIAVRDLPSKYLSED